MCHTFMNQASDRLTFWILLLSEAEARGDVFNRGVTEAPNRRWEVSAAHQEANGHAATPAAPITRIIDGREAEMKQLKGPETCCRSQETAASALNQPSHST